MRRLSPNTITQHDVRVRLTSKTKRSLEIKAHQKRMTQSAYVRSLIIEALK